MQFKNEGEVRTWLDENANEDNLDGDDVIAAFQAIYGRMPSPDEDAFSLVCAGVA